MMPVFNNKSYHLQISCKKKATHIQKSRIRGPVDEVRSRQRIGRLYARCTPGEKRTVGNTFYLFSNNDTGTISP